MWPRSWNVTLNVKRIWSIIFQVTLNVKRIWSIIFQVVRVAVAEISLLFLKLYSLLAIYY